MEEKEMPEVPLALRHLQFGRCVIVELHDIGSVMQRG